VPPVAEQQDILDSLALESTSVEQSIQLAAREIALLREYRTRLIADVVTGKLDVREAAARLPDEAEEPEPPDEADALPEGDEEAEGADLDAIPEEVEA
jgi:type I restriction enzyme S subunit